MLAAYGFGPIRRITGWILVANLLFALLWFRALTGGPMISCRNLAAEACSTASQSLSPGFVIVTLWFITNLILGVVWAATRHRHQPPELWFRGETSR